MGVIAALAGLRVHVLVVGVPGFTLLRLRAAAAVRARGWVATGDPADADLLLVCGEAGGATAAAVDALWAGVPAPRAKRTVRSAGALGPALDSAARVLADDALQRAARPAPAPAPHAAAAGGRPDAVSHRTHGPVGPDWPAGVTVTTTSAMGVVVEAAASVEPAAAAEEDPLGEQAARFVLDCDRAARLLRLAGLPTAAAQLAPVVDRVLAGGEPAAERRLVDAIAGAAGRSLRLAWALGAAGAPEVQGRVVALLGGAAPSPDLAVTAGVLLERPVAVLPLLVVAGAPDA